PELLDKEMSERFKRELLDRYGVTLSPVQANALEFVEGIRDDKYRKDSRAMSELAAMCHMADLWSARGWYNHPLPEDDQWHKACRASVAAAAIQLTTEYPPQR